MQRVAIFLLKHEIELLSLIFSGKEFQMEAPSYIKLFFILYWALANVSNLNCHEDCEVFVDVTIEFRRVHSKLRNSN